MKDDGVAGCLDSSIYKLKSLPSECVARQMEISKNVRYTNTNIDSLQIFVKGQGV